MRIRLLRDLLQRACVAARYGSALPSSILGSIDKGDPSLTLDQLGFDSLAWMEFCIFLELETGLELTPTRIHEMSLVRDIEDWFHSGLEKTVYRR